MKKEVASAVDFLTQLMRPSSKDADKLTSFNENLKRRISEHYLDHWFPEKPFKGSGYRCIRINHNMEPIILEAASESGLSRDDLMSMLPNELTLWIDPREVSYRIGEDGSVGILYEGEEDVKPVKPAPVKPVRQSPSPVGSLTSRSPVNFSPANVSPARSPVHHRSPIPSPVNFTHRPSTSPDFLSWGDVFERSLSPSRYSQLAQYQQQCSMDAYFQQQHFNDYDLKRLAAYVYS